MNKTELKAEIIRQNKTINHLAKLINVSQATFYKKQNEDAFTIKEITIIAEDMSFSQMQIQNIFFNN